MHADDDLHVHNGDNLQTNDDKQTDIIIKLSRYIILQSTYRADRKEWVLTLGYTSHMSDVLLDCVNKLDHSKLPEYDAFYYSLKDCTCNTLNK